jgi:phosphoribosylformylglycinamidine synthase
VGAGLPPCAWLFGEDQARYLIETENADWVLGAALAAGVPARRIGRVAGQGGGAALTLPGAGAISVAELKAANEAWLPGYMAQT